MIDPRTALVDAMERARRACEEESARMKRALDALNAARVARGAEPLDIVIVPLSATVTPRGGGNGQSADDQ